PQTRTRSKSGAAWRGYSKGTRHLIHPSIEFRTRLVPRGGGCGRKRHPSRRGSGAVSVIANEQSGACRIPRRSTKPTRRDSPCMLCIYLQLNRLCVLASKYIRDGDAVTVYCYSEQP